MTTQLPIGQQIMNISPDKRRCPLCLGTLTYGLGCGGRKVPKCQPCSAFFPRGGEFDGTSLMLDGHGVVVGIQISGGE